MSKIDLHKFAFLMLGATGVMSGVWMKNGLADQMGAKNLKHYGMALFLVGWMVVAYALSSDAHFNPLKGLKTWRGMGGLLGSALVVGSVMAMMREGVTMKEKRKWAIGFVLGWLLIGLSTGLAHVRSESEAVNYLKRPQVYLGILSALLVLASMLYVLPKEREKKITDSIGFAMFAVGWVILAIATSLD